MSRHLVYVICLLSVSKISHSSITENGWVQKIKIKIKKNVTHIFHSANIPKSSKSTHMGVFLLTYICVCVSLCVRRFTYVRFLVCRYFFYVCNLNLSGMLSFSFFYFHFLSFILSFYYYSLRWISHYLFCMIASF